ncbi:MAG TPA: hypothetical protein VFU89_05035 [Rhabdochlamydiaceae bacterium]|nr:hypothetical protein [Rhabdochlamydiaceae bacterium]
MTAQTIDLRPATPYQDWQSKQPIFWGTTNSPSAPQIDAAIVSKIRDEVIAANFQTKEPKVITVGPVTAYPREKYSLLSLFLIAVKEAYREGNLLKNSVQIIAGIFTAALGMILLTCALCAAAGLLHAKNGILHLPTILAAALLSGIAIGKFIHCAIDKLKKDDPLSLFAILEKLKQMNQYSHTLTQGIQQHPSSVGDIDLATLANDKDEDGWLDPLSFDIIPKDKIRAPYYFLIGKYVTHIENALKVILNHSDEVNHKFRHPIENRFMTEEEHTKFLKEICSLFFITEAEFLNLWEVRSSFEIPNALLTKTNDLRCMFRVFDFHHLIPKTIKDQYVKNILRHDQIDLLARLWVLLAKPNKWSFDFPDGWIELPMQDDESPTRLCALVPNVAGFTFPPAIYLSKFLTSFEEYKAKSMQSQNDTTILELGRFSPSTDEGFLFKFINPDQTHSYTFFIFKEDALFRLITIAHQDHFATFSILFKMVICSFRLGDDVAPTTPEKLAEFERLTNQR